MLIDVPGHWRVLHDRFSEFFPGHLRPPCRGNGLLHVRERICVPLPQDKVHNENDDHEDQPPSTNESKVSRRKNFWVAVNLILSLLKFICLAS